MQNGLVHIYCGDGKGKTTAATGLALRCVGQGGRVLFFQFLKGSNSGEVKMLEKIEAVTVKKVCDNIKFFCDMSESEKDDARKMYRARIGEVLDMAKDYDMLVLDEVLSAIETGCCELETICEFLKTKPLHLEVIMTGRKADDMLIDSADYVSCIEKVKHPYDKGVEARKMIEY